MNKNKHNVYMGLLEPYKHVMTVQEEEKARACRV